MPFLGQTIRREGDGMPNEVASRQAEEIRLRTMRNQIQTKHQAEVRDLQKQGEAEIQGVITTSQEMVQNLKSAYDVMISKEAESLEQKLGQVRANNEQRIATEKQQGDEEVAKIRANYQSRVKEYRKTGEAQVETVRKEVQAQTDALHDRAIKAERAEKFTSKSSKGGTA
jgi:hypothetical protein